MTRSRVVSAPARRERTSAGTVLRAAAARVGAIWQVMTGETDGADTAQLLEMLVEAVEARATGRASLDERLAGATGRRLVHALRTALVHGWADASLPALPADQVIAVLRALEDVYTDLEPDWSRDLGPVPGPGFELFVDIAHDLRSPLNSILFLAETLQRGGSGPVTDLQKRQLGLIYSAALGLNNLASDALELALDRDRLVEKEPAPFSVTEVMEAVRAIIHPVAEEKGLEMRLLPPAGVDQRIGQPVALGRVLLNLTTNALKFTDEGYVELSAVELGSDRLELSVRDTGPGVNPDAIPNLFQPFRRARARSGVFFSGTGLGLAICRKLVRAMGAELQLETRPQWGTRFYFELCLPTV
jgi:signal transduction histidine kinase